MPEEKSKYETIMEKLEETRNILTSINERVSVIEEKLVQEPEPEKPAEPEKKKEDFI